MSDGTWKNIWWDLITKSIQCQMEHEKIANCSLIIRTFRCQMEHEKISNELWLVWTNMDIYVISGGPKEKYIIAVKKNPTLRLDIIWGSFLSLLIVLKGQFQKIAMKKNIIVFVRMKYKAGQWACVNILSRPLRQCVSLFILSHPI